MVCRNGRPIGLLFIGLLILAITAPVAAQPGGMIRGVVRDVKGQPVEGAVVTMVMTDTGRQFTVKTNRRGEYLQIGLAGGAYTVQAEKDSLASTTEKASVRIGAPSQLDLVLGALSAAAAAADAKELAAKGAELKKLFEEGVAAGNAGRHDEAIEKFNAGIQINPKCYDCYDNIGFAYSQKKDFEKAEAAYKMAAEIKPDDAAAWNGLATVYNAQRKFDEAAKASAKATELSTNLSATGGAGAGADAMYNQGVILWNAGKVAEAKKQFEAAIQANPEHAEAHYQLGMALVNEGNLAGAATEFETYLKLSPTGPNAATAKSLVAQLKK
jgi:tetratricopeptide (TPR) repeat protein